MKNDGIAAVERSTSLRSDSHGTMETGSGKCQEPRSAKPDQRAQPLHRGITAFIIVGTILVGPASYAICNAMPGIQVLRSDAMTAVAVAIFAATYLVIAIGKLPGFHLDRAGAALLGASLMVGSGVLSLDHAYRAVDFDTIVLLLGMMIVVANLRLSGFFTLVADRVARWARHPLLLLAAVVVVAGCFSAFLVNDTICLVLTPLILAVLRALKRDPVPYLLAVAMASNIGSSATITGNPQNMMIGSFSGIPYASFLAALAPVALIGLVVVFAVIAGTYRREFFGAGALAGAVPRLRVNRPLARKAALATAAMIAAFFVIAPPAKVAIVAGALLLLTRRLKPERVYAEIDWSLLLLFAGLFIVVAGLEKAVLTPEVLASAQRLPLDHVAIMSAVAAVLSNLVSNVPAVLVLKPFVQQLADP